MKKVEVLRNKGYPIAVDEEMFRNKMENLQRELNQPTQFKARLHEVAALVRMQEDMPSEVIDSLDDESLETIHNVNLWCLLIFIVFIPANSWNSTFNRNREKGWKRFSIDDGPFK